MKLEVSRQSRDLVREGAQEVKEKLREDLSRWSRVRRCVSLQREIPCLACDGAGKTLCAACQGSGKSGFTTETGEADACPRCGGHGSVTCVECAGRGRIANRHRTKLLWTLWLGGIAWVLVLLQLWGRDLLPEQRAKLLQRGEHGQGVSAPVSRAAGPLNPAGPVVAPGAAQTQHYTGAAGAAGATAPGPPAYAPPTLGTGAHGNSVRNGTMGALVQGSYPQPMTHSPGAAGPMPRAGGNSLPTVPQSWPR